MSSSGVRRRYRTPSRRKNNVVDLDKSLWEQYYEQFKGMQKNISTLKGQVTKLRKQGKTEQSLEKKTDVSTAAYSLIDLLDRLQIGYEQLKVENPPPRPEKMRQFKNEYMLAVKYILRIINEQPRDGISQEKLNFLKTKEEEATAIINNLTQGNPRQNNPRQNNPRQNNERGARRSFENPPIFNNDELPTQNFFKKQFLTFWRVSLYNPISGERTTDIVRVTDTIIIRRAIILKDTTVLRARETVSFKLGDVVYEEISSRRPEDTVRVFFRKEGEINADDMKNFFETYKYGTIVSAYIDRTALTPVPEPSNALFGDACKNYKGEVVVGLIPRNLTYVVTLGFFSLALPAGIFYFSTAGQFFSGISFVEKTYEEKKQLIRNINPLCEKVQNSFFQSIMDTLGNNDYVVARAFGYDGSCLRLSRELDRSFSFKSLSNILLSGTYFDVIWLKMSLAFGLGYAGYGLNKISNAMSTLPGVKERIKRMGIIKIFSTYFEEYKSDLKKAKDVKEVETILSRQIKYSFSILLQFGGLQIVKLLINSLGQVANAAAYFLSFIPEDVKNWVPKVKAIQMLFKSHALSEIMLLLDILFVGSFIAFLQSFTCPFLLYVTGQLENCPYQPVKKEKSELHKDLKF